MAGDFMKPVVSVVDDLLCAGINVTVYNGQLDLIVDTVGKEDGGRLVLTPSVIWGGAAGEVGAHFICDPWAGEVGGHPICDPGGGGSGGGRGSPPLCLGAGGGGVHNPQSHGSRVFRWFLPR